ncbi:hypothetical protein GYA13_03710 [Candidatus Kuenenbacteria bacterium]|nr:hypothetical protein [Candidatus Kuenenbacteria bacterium]
MGTQPEFMGRFAGVGEAETSQKEPKTAENSREAETIESIRQATYDFLTASEINNKMDIVKPAYYPAILNTPAEARAKYGLRQEDILSGIKVELDGQSLIVDAIKAIDLLNNRAGNLVNNVLTQEAAAGKPFDSQISRLKKDLAEFLRVQYQDLGHRTIEVYV